MTKHRQRQRNASGRAPRDPRDPVDHAHAAKSAEVAFEKLREAQAAYATDAVIASGTKELPEVRPPVGMQGKVTASDPYLWDNRKLLGHSNLDNVLDAMAQVAAGKPDPLARLFSEPPKNAGVLSADYGHRVKDMVGVLRNGGAVTLTGNREPLLHGATRPTDPVTAEALRAGSLVEERLVQAEVMAGADTSKAERDAAKRACQIAFAEFLDVGAAGGFHLQRCEHSILHKAFADLKLTVGCYSDYQRTQKLDAAEALGGQSVHSLLLQHDWAAVLGKTEPGADWRLPFPLVCFELQVTGWRVLALCGQAFDQGTGHFDGSSLSTMRLILRSPPAKVGETGVSAHTWITDEAEVELLADGWSHINVKPEPRIDRLIDLVFAQVRAVCIVLDAQVAEAAVVRAPYKRNAPAPDRGPLPAFSHHVVTLNRKPRAAALPLGETSGEHRRSPRLHFRRGHWRHFANFKTWINWMLVGDPELGFVEKEYRL